MNHIQENSFLGMAMVMPETHGSKVIYCEPNSVCFWAEISVQSPAFPGPKHKSRVQRFQNA